MAKVKERIRDYNKADDLMLEQAQTMCNLFTTDKADFIAMYTGLADPFAADFQTAIDDAQAIPLVSEELAELAVKTEVVDNALEAARVQYVKLASYVKLLYPDSKAKQDTFGLDEYDKVRMSQTKMYDLMQRAYKKASDLTTAAALIALGFVQAEIDALNTLGLALYDANEDQEEFKKIIKVRTEDRVKAYNAVWAFMVKVSNASKQVYINDYAKQQNYLLYPEGGGGIVPGQITGLAYDKLTGTLSWNADINSEVYEAAYAPDIPEPLYINFWTGTATSVIYNPGGPDNYLFRVRGKNGGNYGVWSEVLIVIRS